MRMDDIDRVNHLFKEIRESRRTDVELWDFVERLAEELVVMRLEEMALSEYPRKDHDAETLPDWAWDPPELHCG